MITSFDHVSVPMERVEEMVKFYTALGCRVIDQGRIQAVTFGDNKINFHMPELWQDPEFTLRGHTAAPGSGDICFIWEGSQDDLVSTLNSAGADIELGPVPRTGGMNEGSTEGVSIYSRDPDNNLIEFIMY
ncbi:MAG: VOC family virulence protein [Gammaproteobacteria bacterium]|nr:VOC family virulence protein [Gammaproteobacteria bacterium]|tara:strand:+ start:665 stop:1057 length:393 start_codon:yes stop_codon:yes gene_type:complete